MHRAGGVGEFIADPARILQHFSLDRCEPGKGISRSLPRQARGHRRLGNVGRPAEWAFDQTTRALRFEIQSRAEPGLESLAAVEAGKVEDDQLVTTSGIGRRWLSAGMRERTSEMRARSTLA